MTDLVFIVAGAAREQQLAARAAQDEWSHRASLAGDCIQTGDIVAFSELQQGLPVIGDSKLENIAHRIPDTHH